MAGSALLNCPLEVISAICFRLCDHCNGGYNPSGGVDPHSLAALSNFSKTCKVLQHVAQPFLFHFVSDRSRSDFDQIALLRTIHSRPDLAACVKVIDLEGMKVKPSANGTKLTEELVSSLGLPALHTRWHPEDSEFRLVALELILVHTTGLEILTLPQQSEWPLQIIPSLVSQDASVVLWPNLKQLSSFYYYTGQGSYDLVQLAPILLGAPNLEELSLSSGGIQLLTPGMDMAMRSLRRLELHEFAIDPPRLSNLIECCGPLEAIIFSGVEPEDFDDSETMSVVETWQAMEQKKETLKEITMDVDWPWEVESGTLTTLQHFGRLEVLEAHSVAIEAIRTGWSRAHGRQGRATGGNFLFQMLPGSIREIKLTNLDSYLWEYVLRLAAAKASRLLPNLKKVTLCASLQWGRYWDDREKWVEKEEAIRSAFETANIELEIGRYSRS